MIESDFDFDVSAFNADIVPADRRACWWAEDRACGYIKRGAVPGTGYFSAVKFAFA